MDDEVPKLDHQLTPLERTTAELKRFPELIPGAVEKLAPMLVSKLGVGPPDERAAAAVKAMAMPIVQRYVDPQRQPVEDDSTVSTLRQTIQRYGDKIDPDRADALVDRLAADVVLKRPDAIASHLVKFLGSPDGRPYLRSQPGSPPVATAHPAPKPQPARADDGKFTQAPPARPARTRSGF